MGVLNVKESGGDAERIPPEPISKPEPEAQESGAPKEEKGEFVPFSAVEKQRTPGSRRSRAAADMESFLAEKLKPLEDGWKSERTKLEERLSAQSQDYARLQGQLEAIQRMPAPQQAAPAPKADLPDPDKLMREAEKALDDKDIRAYHEKLSAAHEARAARMLAAQAETMRQEFEKKIPQQMPPEVQYLMARHPKVAMAGQMGQDAVIMKDRELQLYRHPPGPQRLAKAFELAEQLIDQVNGQQTTSSQRGFSQDSAQALAAIPTARTVTGGGRKEEGVELSPLQLQTIKDLGWSREEYVRWQNPTRFNKR